MNITFSHISDYLAPTGQATENNLAELNSIFEQCDVEDENGNKGSDDKLNRNEFAKFFEIAKKKFPILNNFENYIQSITEVKPSEVLKQRVDEAKQLVLNNLDNIDLSEFGIPKEKLQRMKKFIANIHYNKVPMGSMQAIKDGIWVNVNSINENQLPSKEEICKILIHEAVHCDSMTNPKDVEQENGVYSCNPYTHLGEEQYCETTALLVMAKLVEKGEIKDFACYPVPNPKAPFSKPPHHNVSRYLKERELLEQDINGWLDIGYSNVPKNKNCDITVAHRYRNYDPKQAITITKGASFTINGDNSFNKEKLVIGENCYLEGMGSNMGNIPVFRLCSMDGKQIAGHLVFDNVLPLEEELSGLPFRYRENQDDSPVFQVECNGVVYTGKMYNLAR